MCLGYGYKLKTAFNNQSVSSETHFPLIASARAVNRFRFSFPTKNSELFFKFSLKNRTFIVFDVRTVFIGAHPKLDSSILPGVARGGTTNSGMFIVRGDGGNIVQSAVRSKGRAKVSSVIWRD